MQGSLFPTAEEALRAGREAASASGGANEAWCRAAETLILAIEPGACFLAEDIVERLAHVGARAEDGRAIGGVIQRLARTGSIERSGRFLPARSSHGSPKPEWRRVSRG